MKTLYAFFLALLIIPFQVHGQPGDVDSIDVRLVKINSDTLEVQLRPNAPWDHTDGILNLTLTIRWSTSEGGELGSADQFVGFTDPSYPSPWCMAFNAYLLSNPSPQLNNFDTLGYRYKNYVCISTAPFNPTCSFTADQWQPYARIPITVAATGCPKFEIVRDDAYVGDTFVNAKWFISLSGIDITDNSTIVGDGVFGNDACSQLTYTPDPEIICGNMNMQFGETTIHAYEAASADKYQFHFQSIPTEPTYSRHIAWPSRSFLLIRWSTKPLKAGRTYLAKVRTSYDNGVTYGPWGPTCTVRMGYPPPRSLQERNITDQHLLLQTDLTVWPNPVTDRIIQVQLSGSATPSHNNYTLLLMDVNGKVLLQNMQRFFENSNEFTLQLPIGMTSGLYILQLRSYAGHTYSAKLSVQ